MKVFKRVLYLTLLISIFSLFVVQARQEGMSSVRSTPNELAWRYYTGEYNEYGESIYLVNDWKEVWGDWYYFGEDGKSKQNTWAEINGRWYYFDNFSRMLSDTTTPDGYYVGPDGAWVTGVEVADTSRWIGNYIADDGQTISVTSAGSDSVTISFRGYSEEGWYEQNYVLLYTNAEKTQAAMNNEINDREVYTLTETGIEVSIEPYGGWKQGAYTRQ